MEKTRQVMMTAAEADQFEEFLKAKAKKAAEEKRKADLKAYNELVDNTIDRAMPRLVEVSEAIANTKKDVMEEFQQAIALKGDLLKVEEGQRSHTFTNSAGNKRITLGYYVRDNYRDTAEEGIAMVKQSIEGLATDDNSRALVDAVMSLLARDKSGSLKASRVLKLRQLADDIKDERFKQGVDIIVNAYQPTISRQYIRAEVKPEGGEWMPVNLGMTEA